MQVASSLRHCSAQHLQNTHARVMSEHGRFKQPAECAGCPDGHLIRLHTPLVSASSGLNQAAFMSRQLCHRGCMQQRPPPDELWLLDICSTAQQWCRQRPVPVCHCLADLTATVKFVHEGSNAQQHASKARTSPYVFEAAVPIRINLQRRWQPCTAMRRQGQHQADGYWQPCLWHAYTARRKQRLAPS